MSTEQRQLDLSKLPKIAQYEILDFYEFLIKKYSIEQDKNALSKRFEEFLAEPIYVEHMQRFSREELHE